MGNASTKSSLSSKGLANRKGLIASLCTPFLFFAGSASSQVAQTQSETGAAEEIVDETPLTSYKSISAVTEQQIIAFEFTKTQILVDNVYVNDRGPYRFMFDSGAQGAGRIDAALVVDLGLTQTREVRNSDTSDRQGPVMPVFRIDKLKFGDLEYGKLDFVSRNYNVEQAVERRGEIAGILGFGLFEDLLFAIDFPNSEFRIKPGKLPEADNKKILALDPKLPVPAIEVQFNGKMFKAFIDTGSMIEILIPAKLAKKMEFATEPIVVGRARSGAGVFDVKMGTVIGDLVVGTHRVENPTFFIADGFNHIILGSSFFREFVLEFDSLNNRVRLEKAR